MSESTVIVKVSLPSELQDMIIERMLDLDNAYLLLASLVCRDWRYYSYQQVFSSICFDSHSIPVFASFLDNPFSRTAIFPRVRRLRILGNGKASLWTSTLLIDLVKLLHHLVQIGRISDLVLDNLTWAVLDPALAPILTDFLSIERLSMRRICFAQLGQFSDFVAGFRLMRSFDLESIECPPLVGWNHPLPSLAPYELGHCVSLERSNATSSAKLTWVYPKCISREERSVSSIHGAQIFCISPTSSDLLRSLGPLLARLHIISENITADEDIASLDISMNPSIRHLHLSSPTRVLSMISWLPPLLARVKGSNLKTLHMSFAQSRQFHLDRPFLKHIAGILDKPQYQGLEMIEFIASSASCGRLEDDVKQDIISCIRSCLPYWERKGILAFNFD
ncbi:MAG: hypothetical protein NXY57DRAFT_317867 [Lentinula lateritia]|nr:MAG: hypothetical protein NXY57DRAFT_317867 [Lentinula lateritia]